MPRPLQKRLLCLWLPNWPVQRLRSSIAVDAPDEPSAADCEAIQAVGQQIAEGSPLVLWGIDPRRGRLVVACCESAAALGICAGMTVGEADSLARRGLANGAQQDLSPLILQHDSEADVEALRALAEDCAEQLSPIVAIEPLDDFLWAGQTLHQPQSLLLDVTGVGALFGGEDRLLAATASLLRRCRLHGRIAIAQTAGAAWAVAHYGRSSRCERQETGDGRRETKEAGFCASDSETEEDFFIVPTDHPRAALDPLPVAALRIRPETASMLRRLGIDRIDSLLRLPRGGLAMRLGSDLLRRLDQALGEVDEPLPAHHAAAEDRASVDLEYPTSDLDILGHQLELLVRQIAGGLSARQRGALRIICRFDLEKPPAQGSDEQLENQPPRGTLQPSLEIRVGLFTPSATADHLMRLLSGVLERYRFPSPAHRLVVAATMTGPLATRQPALAGMGGGDEGSVADLAKLVDGLSSRLGRSRVLGVDLTDDPLPEHAVRLRPLAGQPIGAVIPGRPMRRGRQGRGRQGRGRQDRGRQDQGRQDGGGQDGGSLERSAAAMRWNPPAPTDPLRRPLAMLPRPVPLAVPSSRDVHTDGPPPQFRHGGRIHRIVRHWGPERLETGWWSGPMHRRDYYRIETEEGSWLWIYRDLRKGQWWLHGFFS